MHASVPGNALPGKGGRMRDDQILLITSSRQKDLNLSASSIFIWLRV